MLIPFKLLGDLQLLTIFTQLHLPSRVPQTGDLSNAVLLMFICFVEFYWLLTAYLWLKSNGSCTYPIFRDLFRLSRDITFWDWIVMLCSHVVITLVVTQPARDDSALFDQFSGSLHLSSIIPCRLKAMKIMPFVWKMPRSIPNKQKENANLRQLVAKQWAFLIFFLVTK